MPLTNSHFDFFLPLRYTFLYVGQTIKCYGYMHDDIITTSMENVVNQNQYCSDVFVESHPSVDKKFGYKLVLKKNKQLPKYNHQARQVPIIYNLIKKNTCELKIINLDEEESFSFLKDINESSIHLHLDPEPSSIFEQHIQENAEYFQQKDL